jgi:3-deoxy-D-arabino-heptulosonate 7-phosphate (DAHP) synthase
MTRTSDTRITGYEPLLAPSALLDQLPQSVTDACMDFATTAAVLAGLAAAVRTRRRS